MNPITMYAAAQVVADRRRDTESRARSRRLARHHDEKTAPSLPAHHPVFGRRRSAAPESTTRAA